MSENQRQHAELRAAEGDQWPRGLRGSCRTGVSSLGGKPVEEGRRTGHGSVTRHPPGEEGKNAIPNRRLTICASAGRWNTRRRGVGGSWNTRPEPWEMRQTVRRRVMRSATGFDGDLRTNVSYTRRHWRVLKSTQFVYQKDPSVCCGEWIWQG